MWEHNHLADIVVVVDSFLESIVELAEAVVAGNRKACPEDQDFGRLTYSCHAYEAVRDSHQGHHQDPVEVMAVRADY